MTNNSFNFESSCRKEGLQARLNTFQPSNPGVATPQKNKKKKPTTGQALSWVKLFKPHESYSKSYQNSLPCSEVVKSGPGPVAVALSPPRGLASFPVCAGRQAQPLLRHLIGRLRIGLWIITRQYASRDPIHPHQNGCVCACVITHEGPSCYCNTDMCNKWSTQNKK